MSADDVDVGASLRGEPCAVETGPMASALEFLGSMPQPVWSACNFAHRILTDVARALAVAPSDAA
jgi:hypothetical protein